MHSTGRFIARLALFTAILVSAALLSIAQQPKRSGGLQTRTQPRTGNTATKSEDKSSQVVIQRAALRLRDPISFQVPLRLEPIRSLQITAPVDGVIRSIHVKAGQQADLQAEAIRFDDTMPQLLMKRATAKLKVAEIELDQAKAKSDATQTALAQAKLDVAKAESDLAKHRFDNTSIRIPFVADVFRVFVEVGQFVRAGDPLLSVGDTSRLQVEIPVDREQAAVGKSIKLRIETKTIDAKIDKVLPVDEKFESLRALANSLVSAIVIVDNPQRTFHPHQAVYAELIPRHPVVEVQTSSIANGADGQRNVQVLRDSLIRNIGVQLLGQVGVDRVFVSGPFSPNDEVIVKSSQPLPDGTLIRLSTQESDDPRRTIADGSRQPGQPTGTNPAGAGASQDKKKKSVGF